MVQRTRRRVPAMQARGRGEGSGLPAVVAGDLAGCLDAIVQQLAQARHPGAAKDQATPGRLNALAILRAGGPLRVGDLAERAGVAVATMSRIVDKVVQCGWAQRHMDATDHRVCVLTITGAGVALLDAVQRGRVARLAAGLASLEPEPAFRS